MKIRLEREIEQELRLDIRDLRKSELPARRVDWIRFDFDLRLEKRF